MKTVCLVGASLLLASARDWARYTIGYYETALFWRHPKITVEEIIFTNKIRQIWKRHTWGNTNDLIIQHPDGNDKNPSLFAFRRKHEVVWHYLVSHFLCSAGPHPAPHILTEAQNSQRRKHIYPTKQLWVFHKGFPLNIIDWPLR